MTERQITDAIANVARADATFRIELARALLRGAAARDVGPGQRARALLRHLPRKHVDFETQDRYDSRANFFAIGREILGGRLTNLWNDIDWVWRAPSGSFLLMLEVKTAQRPTFQPDQLARYPKAAKRAGAEHFGVMALTTRLPKEEELRKVRRQKAFVGSMLWHEAAADLRALSPAEEPHGQIWQAVLGELVPLPQGHPA